MALPQTQLLLQPSQLPGKATASLFLEEPRLRGAGLPPCPQPACRRARRPHLPHSALDLLHWVVAVHTGTASPRAHRAVPTPACPVEGPCPSATGQPLFLLGLNLFVEGKILKPLLETVKNGDGNLTREESVSPEQHISLWKNSQQLRWTYSEEAVGGGETLPKLRKQRLKMDSLLDLDGDVWGPPVRKAFEVLQSCSNIELTVLQVL